MKGSQRTMKTNLKNRPTRTRNWSPQTEELEKRILLVSNLLFDSHFDADQNAANGIVTNFDFSALDFLPGNALIRDFRGTDPNDPGFLEGGVGQLYFQAKLGAFLDGGSFEIQNDGGLGYGAADNYGITAVLRADVQLDSITTTPGAPIPSFFEFDEVINGELRLYYDVTPDANDLTGTGFVDGIEILRADVAEINGNFSVNLSGVSPLVTQFDQFPPNDPARDNYGGFLTIRGVGGTNIKAKVTDIATPLDPASDGRAYFSDSSGTLTIADLDNLNINFDNKLPFEQTNPSRQFFAGGVNSPFLPYTPDLGAPAPGAHTGAGGDINGLPKQNPLEKSDFQVQSDANIAFVLVPGSIHGFKYEDFDKDGNFDPSRGDKGWGGFRFELWKDANNNNVIDAGDSLVDWAISHDDDTRTVLNEAGEFWFENVVPGTYVLREYLPTGPVNPHTGTVEIMPSNMNLVDRAIDVWARQELVYESGAALFSEVLDRHIFYNNSYFDTATAANPGFNDNNAIAPDKDPYIAGSGDNDFDNWSSYVRGINGVAIDFKDSGVHSTITGADFEFRVGTDNFPALWADAPAPINVYEAFDTPAPGTKRVFIEWADNAIRDTNLQVIVKANGNTRIPLDDIHYWTNIVGEGTGDVQANNKTTVDGNDASLVFGTATGFGSAGITHHADFDRNNVVDGNDATIAFDNATGFDPLDHLNVNTTDEQYLGEWRRYEDVVGSRVMFGNFVKGSIHGFKFNDADGDGLYDPPNVTGPTLSGWDLPLGGIPFAVYMTAPGAAPQLVAVSHSNVEGEFWFNDLMPGQYVVWEILDGKDPYTGGILIDPATGDTVEDVSDAVTPSPGNLATLSQASNPITVRSRQEYVWKAGAADLQVPPSLKHEVLVDGDGNGLNENLMFGNQIEGSIHGFKFEDVDGDGKYIPANGDKPWDGLVFDLYRQNDVTGAYTYVRSETTRGADIDFSGTVDADEHGHFWFTGLGTGTYQLVERPSYMMTSGVPYPANPLTGTYVGPDGQAHPAANAMYVNSRQQASTFFVGSREELVWAPGAAMLPAGSLSHEILHRDEQSEHPFDGPEQLVFGNYIPGSVHGFKCEDLDADGTCWEVVNNVRVLEPGFPGIEIFLSRKDTDGIYKIVDSEPTDANGFYWFEGLAPGDYIVHEESLPVGWTTDPTGPDPYVGLLNQGELISNVALGTLEHPNDNVMESFDNAYSFNIKSRQEYVWKLGAGNFERFCFLDSPSATNITGQPNLVEVTGNITHQLCNGDMATHTVTVEVPQAPDAWHVDELEFVGNRPNDGGIATWTSGTYMFTAPDLAAMGFPVYSKYVDVNGNPVTAATPGAQPLIGSGLKFTVGITAGKIAAPGGFTVTLAPPSNANGGSLIPNTSYTGVAATNVSTAGNRANSGVLVGAGSGATFNVVVGADGKPTVTVNAVGKDYVPGDVIKIPFTAIGGQTSADDIVIRIDVVRSEFDDLRPTGANNVNDNPDTYGPDALINLGGKAYEVGEMFTITPPNSVIGDVLSLVDANPASPGIQPVSQGIGYGAQGDPDPVTYTNIPADGGGGLTFDVVISGRQVKEVILKNPGAGYTAGQLVSIDGAQLASSSSADVFVRIGTVGDDRIMLKVVEVGHTEIAVSIAESSDDWGQSSPQGTITINSLTGGNPSQTVVFNNPGIKLTGTGYDDVITYGVTLDGVPYTGVIKVGGDNDVNGIVDDTYDNGANPTTFTIAINNGTLKKEILVPNDGLIFENYVKGSIHGVKYHDKNLNGIKEMGIDEPFPGIEFSPKVNNNFVAPDIDFVNVGAGLADYNSVIPLVANDNGLAGSLQYFFRNGLGTGVSTHTNWTTSAIGHNNVNSASSTLTDPVGSAAPQTSSLTLVAFTPFDAGIGFSKMIRSTVADQAFDPGDVLSFYIDDQFKASWTGNDAQFTDAWFELDEGWGWHKYTWTLVNDNDADDKRSTVSAYVDDIRFTARTGDDGQFWINDLRPATYEVVERLDLVGQFDDPSTATIDMAPHLYPNPPIGEVMPSFMNVSQWATSVVSRTSEFDKNGNNVYDAGDGDMTDDRALAAPDGIGWSPAVADDHVTPLHNIVVKYDQAVYVTSVDVHELGLGGAIEKVEINDGAGNWIDITTLGSRAGNKSTYDLDGNMPSFRTDRVRVTINTGTDWAANPNTPTAGFEKIDAIELHGMIQMKSSSTITIASGDEFVWQAGAANLPNPTLRQERPAAPLVLDPDVRHDPRVDNALTFSNLIKGSIHAFKYEDMIGNGVFDAGVDKPWAGFKFELFTKDIFGDYSISLGTQTSNAAGEVWFTGLKPLQDYLVMEIGPAFVSPAGEIMSSTLDKYEVLDLPSGAEYVWSAGAAKLDANSPIPKFEIVRNQLQFGNYVKGSIHGFKFEDLNGDGVYDPNMDIPFGGIEFNIAGLDAWNSNVQSTVTTNQHGEFWFENLIPGRYNVSERLWTHTVSTDKQPSREYTVLSRQELVWKSGAAKLDSVFHVNLSGAQEVPPVDTNAIASAKVMIVGNQVMITGSYSGLSSPLTGAHLHAAAPGVNGGVIVPLLTTGGTDGTFSATAPLSAANMAALLAGNTYINIHTSNNPSGELRGQVTTSTLRTEVLQAYDPTNGNYGLHFGNAVEGSIHGFKCHDVDADGVCETTNHVVFVLDISDSMLQPIEPSVPDNPATPNVNESVPGDQNGDGFFNTKLDSAIKAFIDLNADLHALAKPNTEIHVGVVFFSGNGNVGDALISNGLGAGGFTTPNADNTDPLGGAANGVPDVIDALRSARTPALANLFSFAIGHDTKLQAGVAAAASMLAEWGANPHLGNVYLLSDGADNASSTQGLIDEVANLSNYASNVVADAVGTDVGNFIDNLKVIDPDAEVLATDLAVIAGVSLGAAYNPPEMPTGGIEFQVTGVLGDGRAYGPVTITTEADMMNPHFGEFWLEGLYPGTYTVTEMIPAGYTSSTHPTLSHTMTIESRQEYVWQKGAARLPSDTEKVEVLDNKLTFGNFVTGSIHGFKFEDFNNDGSYKVADGDQGLAGVTFTLTGTDNQGRPVNLSTFSNAFGEFEFLNVWPGSYTVAEAPTPGFIATTPTSWNVNIESQQEYVWDPSIVIPAPKIAVLADGDDDPTNDGLLGEKLMFGNTITGSIHGFKFHDYNANNVYEWAPSGDILPGGDTDGDGDVDVHDNPLGKDVNGDSFINFYADLDLAHPGLQTDRPWAGFNFEIWKDTNGNGSLGAGDTLIATLTSGADGQFDITGLVPDLYFVREIDSASDNIHPSGPTVVSVMVDSREEHVWNDGAANLGDHDFQDEVLNHALRFGNYIESSIHGCAYLDGNVNGIHENGENAVGAVRLQISGPSGTFTRTTSTNGLFDVNGLRPGTYSVQAVNANGWLPTEVPVSIVVYSGEEAVHEDGAAANRGMLATNQIEVNVGQDLFVGVRLAPRAVPAAVAGAVDGVFGNIETSEVENSGELEIALHNSQGRRRAAVLTAVKTEENAVDRAFVDFGSDLDDSGDEDNLNSAFLA